MNSSSLIYQWLAGQISALGHSARIVSLVPEINGSAPEAPLHEGGIRRHRMSLLEFEKNCSSVLPLESLHGGGSAAMLLLDFSWAYPSLFEKTIGLLDKIVFWVRPEMESLSQVYKWIKGSSGLNSRIECLLAYDGENERKGSLAFEKFSEMVSRRLGVDLSWLGCCPVSGMPSSSQALNLDLLLSQTNPLTLSEKKALAQSVFSE